MGTLCITVVAVLLNFFVSNYFQVRSAGLYQVVYRLTLTINVRCWVRECKWVGEPMCMDRREVMEQ